MTKAVLVLFLVLAMALVGCSASETPQQDAQETPQTAQGTQDAPETSPEEEAAAPQEQSGVQVSEPFYSEEYDTQMVDLYNFNTEDRRLLVETLCFDSEGRQLETNDTEELTLPAESRWGWIPVCPDNTESFSVRFQELSE